MVKEVTKSLSKIIKLF
ncbi:hypothetical protein [Nostoc sp.]